LQHADHFTRILNERENFKKEKYWWGNFKDNWGKFKNFWTF
jgi:hypothetical protein